METDLCGITKKAEERSRGVEIAILFYWGMASKTPFNRSTYSGMLHHPTALQAPNGSWARKALHPQLQFPLPPSNPVFKRT